MPPSWSLTLPSPLTSLLGREADLAMIRQVLLRADVRAVTLFGPPGVGKTRLAVAAASQVAGEFEDGVAFVDLTAVGDATGVAPSIASALDIPQRARLAGLAALIAAFKRRRLLLVLDNFEHVLPASRDLGALLAACPDLKLLVTSRAALRVSWEQRLSVDVLQIPNLDGSQPPDVIAENPSVALFIQRAQAARPGFALGAGNTGAVAEICVRLDGLPLAIELAAARIDVLTPQAILERLHQRLDLLTDGPRDLPERHRTLRGALAWSYDQLTEAEGAVLRRLAVFAGGATLEAAEAVCGALGDDHSVLDRLATLVNGGMLQERAEPDGRPRFRMLESLRAYADERLRAAGEEREIRQRHAAHFLSWAERAEVEMNGPEQGAWLERLERDHDNLRAALRFARDHDHHEAGLRAAAALARFWERHGYVSEARGWVDAFLAHEHGGSEALTAKALTASGNLARVEGDYAGARSRYERALRIARDLGDARRVAVVLNNLGAVAKEQGDYAAARDLYEESLALKRANGDRWGIALTLNNLGAVSNAQRQYAAARGYLGESLALFRDLQDRWGLALATNNLGATTAHMDNPGRAIALHADSLAIRKELNDRWGIAESLEGLARVAAVQRADERSVALYAAAAAVRETFQLPLPPDEQPTVDDQIEALRSRMGERAFQKEWRAGRAMSVDDACGFVAAEHVAPPAPSHPPDGASTSDVPLRIYLLGRFRLIVRDQAVPGSAWGRPQALAILQYLLLRRHRPTPADELVEVFWPQAASVEATSLYNALSRIRRGMAGHGVDPTLLRREPAGYRIVLPRPAWVDLDAFERGLDDVRRSRLDGDEAAARRLRETLAVYAGDLLEDAPYADWCALARERVRAAFVDGVVQLAQALESAGHDDDAAQEYLRALERDGVREDAHRGLMRIYARTGRRELALRQYRACTSRLADDLSVDPAPETDALFRSILRAVAPDAPPA